MQVGSYCYMKGFCSCTSLVSLLAFRKHCTIITITVVHYNTHTQTQNAYCLIHNTIQCSGGLGGFTPIISPKPTIMALCQMPQPSCLVGIMADPQPELKPYFTKKFNNFLFDNNVRVRHEYSPCTGPCSLQQTSQPAKTLFWEVL